MSRSIDASMAIGSGFTTAPFAGAGTGGGNGMSIAGNFGLAASGAAPGDQGATGASSLATATAGLSARRSCAAKEVGSRAPSAGVIATTRENSRAGSGAMAADADPAAPRAWRTVSKGLAPAMSNRLGGAWRAGIGKIARVRRAPDRERADRRPTPLRRRSEPLQGRGPGKTSGLARSDRPTGSSFNPRRRRTARKLYARRVALPSRKLQRLPREWKGPCARGAMALLRRRRRSCPRRCRCPSSCDRASSARSRACGPPGTFDRDNGRGRTGSIRIRCLRACARRRCR